MPLPPSSSWERTFSSVGFLPLFNFSLLKRPFSPGPIFFSVLSALWQGVHCWKTSFPFSGSPFLAARAVEEAMAKAKPKANTFEGNIRISVLQIGETTRLQFFGYGRQPACSPARSGPGWYRRTEAFGNRDGPTLDVGRRTGVLPTINAGARSEERYAALRTSACATSTVYCGMSVS